MKLQGDLWTMISIQEWRKGMPPWQRRREKKEDKRKAKHLRTMTLMTLNYVKCVVLVLVAFRLCD